VDDVGNLYIAVKGGIEVYTAEGNKLGKINVSPDARNCTFGGPDRKTLVITAKNTLYTLPMPIPGKP
jgi:gluconolactonase